MPPKMMDQDNDVRKLEMSLLYEDWDEIQRVEVHGGLPRPEKVCSTVTTTTTAPPKQQQQRQAQQRPQCYKKDHDDMDDDMDEDDNNNKVAPPAPSDEMRTSISSANDNTQIVHQDCIYDDEGQLLMRDPLLHYPPSPRQPPMMTKQEHPVTSLGTVDTATQEDVAAATTDPLRRGSETSAMDTDSSWEPLPIEEDPWERFEGTDESEENHQQQEAASAAMCDHASLCGQAAEQQSDIPRTLHMDAAASAPRAPPGAPPSNDDATAAAATGAVSGGNYVANPTQRDVLCGKGIKMAIHNDYYLGLCRDHAQQYVQTKKRGLSGKKGLALKIVRAIQATKGRFLRPKGSGWEELSEEQAMSKAAHCMRDLALRKDIV